MKKNALPTVEVIVEIEVPIRRYWWQFWLPKFDHVEVTAEFEYEGGYDGIGSYEFWGQKCFDKGEWRVEGIWFKSFELHTALPKGSDADAINHAIIVHLENMAEDSAGTIEEEIYRAEAD